MIKKYINSIKKVGMKNAIKSLYKRIYFKILKKRFRFDSWHASSPIESKPYKFQVIEMVNKSMPTNVLEIGCGLGEILANLSVPIRLGVDYDLGVINAANYINNEINFYHHDFENIESIQLPVSEIDILLLINWTHELSWEALKINLHKLNKKYPINTIVIDTINPDVAGYPYHHNEDNLKEIGTVQSSINGMDEVRKINLIKFKK